MMGFSDQVRAFAMKTEKRAHAAFGGIVKATRMSIVEGSPITGAPGQPVGVDGSPADGELRDSWHVERRELEATISTSAPDAGEIEDNLRGVRFHNHGPHSIKLTVAGFDRIVDTVVSEGESR